VNPTCYLLLAACLLALTQLSACRSAQGPTRAEPTQTQATAEPKLPKPDRFVLVDKPIGLQDQQEPILTKVEFEFSLPQRPRRCRLVLRYSGVAAALSEDYRMGRFRDKVELNSIFIMDLNTYSQEEDQQVEHTQWISAKLLRAHNKLVFYAGDDGAREGVKKHDSFELRSVVVELDW